MKNISSSASSIATSALRAIPFGDIIGGPLEACILAQEKAAITTVNFIERVGMQRRPVFDAAGKAVKIKNENGVDEQLFEWEAIYLSFQFIQGGRMVRLNVPMLSVVPIPFIAINTIDINFKASISASAATFEEDKTNRSNDATNKTYESESDYTSKTSRSGIISSLFKNTDNYNSTYKGSSSSMSATISSKKDSTATAQSKYSVEYTMDVAIHASQDSMPAGMAKILEMIGAAMDLCDPDGEFVTNSTELTCATGKTAQLEVSYKSPTGLLISEGFTLYKYKNVNHYNNYDVPNSSNSDKKADCRKFKEKRFYDLDAGHYILETDDKTQILQLVVKEQASETPSGE